MQIVCAHDIEQLRISGLCGGRQVVIEIAHAVILQINFM
jgi:hypothetical protein